LRDTDDAVERGPVSARDGFVRLARPTRHIHRTANHRLFARARAQSVVDYLASQGIDKARFIVDAQLPPEAHRETEDADIQAEDRFVEMTLITVGR
jgi:hypothetical protein